MSQLPGMAALVPHYGKAAEKAYHRTVTEMLETLGWVTCHTYPLRTEYGWRTGTTAKGWPDIVALRREFVVAVEVKGYDARGRPTPFQPGQVDWLTRFSALAGGRAWVLRPTDDWPTTVQMMRRPREAPRRFGWDLAA